MAREHPAGDHQVHPRGLLTYALAEIRGGPWPGRLAIGPLPFAEPDIADIAAWGADLVLSLVEDDEVAGAGISDLAGLFAAHALPCVRAPIVDYGTPSARFELDWPMHRHRVLGLLGNGGKILVHCKGGKGRSGTIAAALLIAGGIDPDQAIRLVRTARPGAIETPGQEAWLRGQPPGPRE